MDLANWVFERILFGRMTIQKAPFFKRARFGLLGITLTLGSLCFGEPVERQSNEGDGYVFKGAIPFKVYKGQASPIVAAEKNRLLLRTDTGDRKVRFGQNQIGVRNKLVATRFYSKISEIDVSFDNRAAQKRQQELDTALAADAEYAQSQMDQLNSTTTERASGQPQNATREEFGEAMKEAGDTALDMQGADLGDSFEMADTIFLTFDVETNFDAQNAYAVIVLHHDLLDAEGKRIGEQRIFSVGRAGVLRSGIAEKVELSVRTHEQRFVNLNLELYLFTEDGEESATNLSKDLKKLSSTDYDALIENLKKRTSSVPMKN